MIPRTLTDRLLASATAMPAVGVTGPRQSGKTTLCRAAFPGLRYVSLEPLDTRQFATEDPRGFLGEYGSGAILDEVQRAPYLFPYLQEEIDRDPTPGRFVLTGSQQFGLTEAITQSLAGRIALMHLLPLSLKELHRFPSAPDELWTTVWAGGYPRIHDRGLDPNQWLADYLATYVQQDVRQVQRVSDLDAFSRFLRLAAGRTGQEENLSGLGSDAGISHPTVRAWLSVLEASFVVFRIPSWHRSFRKRQVKSAKMHFLDSGLACHLLGIRSPDQLRAHPLRGALFESWTAAEVLKARVHRGHAADLFHLRESRGIEVDLVVESADRVIGVEAKSGATVASDFFTELRGFSEEVAARYPHLECDRRLVYGGEIGHRRLDTEVIPWRGVQDVSWV
ncbi:MAG: ATP-binding protein [Gemmatimonadota bacterium]|nr:ATP-binding protein [Gemmatimonadota bacterium]